MGTSTDAILAYGIPVEEETTPGNLTEEEWEEIREEWETDKIEARGFDVIYHCSGDYPMYFLAVPNTEVRAWRGSPKKVDFHQTGTVAAVQWRLAMDKLGVDTTNAGWYLFSMWSY